MQADCFGDCLKSIASFSEDCINQGIKQLDPKKQVDLKKMTKELSDVLGKKDRRTKIGERGPSVETTFQEHILVQIRSKLTEYENSECRGKQNYELTFNFKTNFETMTMKEKKDAHEKIIVQEGNVQTLDLVLKFHRGLLYLMAYTDVDVQLSKQEAKKWIEFEFGTCWSTIERYMKLALLIKKYPRLVVCGLLYTQLQKHNKRLQTFLDKETEGLKERLSLPLNIKTQGQNLDITPSNDIYTPRDKESTDPDIEFLDKSTPQDDKKQNKILDWMCEQSPTGLKDKLYPPPDEEEDMDLECAISDIRQRTRQIKIDASSLETSV